MSADVLVVHQQDLQAVMNALWAGGAEAMELMDQRVISTSAVRCVGNVLRLHGRLYSPPYEVRAIGNPADLRTALTASPAVQSYVRDAADVGLGWSVRPTRSTAGAARVLRHHRAAVGRRCPTGAEILPGLEAAEAEQRADESTRAPGTR